MAHGHLPTWLDRWLQRWMPSPAQVAEAELKDAELSVLAAQTQAEYAALNEKIHLLTVAYHKDRIARLTRFLGYEPDSPAVQDLDFSTLFENKTSKPHAFNHPDLTPMPRTEHG